MISKVWIASLGAVVVAAGAAWYGIIQQRASQPQPTTPVAAVVPNTQPASAMSEPGSSKPANAAPAEPVPAKPAQPAVADNGVAKPDAAKPDAAKPDLAKPETPAVVSQGGVAPANPTPASSAIEPSKVPVPTFDIVRVEPTGDAVVAGRGVPGGTVTLLRNGEFFARAVADVGGQWAIVPANPLPKGDSELSLKVTTPDGRTAQSDQVVSVHVPEKAGDSVVVLLNTPDQPSKVLSDLAAAEPAKPASVPVKQEMADTLVGQPGEPATPPLATPSVAKPVPEQGEPAKPAVADSGAAKPSTAEPAIAEPVKPKSSGTESADAAAGTPPASEPAKPATVPVPPQPLPPRGNVAVVTVEADESGRFFVTGKAAPGATVRIYLNDTIVATVTAAADGSFGLTVEKGITPGVYHVRADDVDPKTGLVLTRAEVPFVMEARQPAKPASPPAVVVADVPAKTMPIKPDPDAAQPTPAGSQPADAAKPDVAKPAALPQPAVAAQSDVGVKPAATSASALPTTPEPATPQPTPSVAVVAEIKTVTIVRGDNLWAISRKTYGHGIRYTVIYDANTQQIRNPALIFPKQVFVLPEDKQQTP